MRSTRLSGRKGSDEGKYHIYLTNLSLSTYRGEEVGQLYRMRWQVEKMYSHLKTDSHLDEQPSDKEHLVKLRMYGVLLAYGLVGRLREKMRKQHPSGRYPVSLGMRSLATLGAKVTRENQPPLTLEKDVLLARLFRAADARSQ